MKVSRNFYENASFGGFAIHLQGRFKMLVSNKEAEEFSKMTDMDKEFIKKAN